MNLPWTQLGFPSLTLPMADVDGLPVGLQLSADRNRDEPLLTWAREIEAVLGPV
jgi:Asp-tRNA(Asn)/Glu-tRNA(Gln) amidotransferase A subunit family amidase